MLEILKAIYKKMLPGLILNKAGQHDLHGGEELLFILTDLQGQVFLYICLLKKQACGSVLSKSQYNAAVIRVYR